MTGKITFTMIKPMAVKKCFIGPILDKVAEGGFKISAMKLVHLTREQAEKFYEIHKERPFYESLTAFMSSGPIVAAILEKENAVEDYRKFIGATNPDEAEEGSIRDLYGTDLGKNAVHGSDSDDNANIESDFFFSRMERY